MIHLRLGILTTAILAILMSALSALSIYETFEKELVSYSTTEVRSFRR